MSITRAQVRAAVARYPRGITTRGVGYVLGCAFYNARPHLMALAAHGEIAKEPINRRDDQRDNLWKPMEART